MGDVSSDVTSGDEASANSENELLGQPALRASAGPPPVYEPVEPHPPPMPDPQEGPTVAAEERAGNEVDWATFAVPAHAAGKLQEARGVAARKVSELEQPVTCGSESLDDQDATISPESLRRRMCAQKLKMFISDTEIIEIGSESDPVLVSYLKQFDNRTLDEATMELLTGHLYLNRRAAAAYERMAVRIGEAEQELLGKIEAGWEGWWIFRELQDRIKGRVEALWQVHLLGAWLGVPSERDCLFRSSWLDAPIPLEEEQPEPGIRNGISDGASVADTGTSPPSTEGPGATAHPATSLSS